MDYMPIILDLQCKMLRLGEQLYGGVHWVEEAG